MRKRRMHLRLALVLAFGLGQVALLQSADLFRTNLFTAGEGGYALYRIPALLRTTQGSLLAIGEARSRAESDWSQTDLLLRRSEDRGRTWSAPFKPVALPSGIARNPVALAQNLGTPEERTLHNPVFISDQDGTVHLIFCAEYNRAFYTRSRDDGRTFETPRELTPVFEGFRADYDWKVLATGPGHGLQISAGKPGAAHRHAGRLIVPVWLSTGAGGHGHRPSAIATIFSDDRGVTWQRGEIIARDPDPLANPSEAMAVELGDGRVMLNIRNESPALRRAVAVSPDGATGWTRPEFADALFDPICQASLIRLPGNPREREATLIFSNPDSRYSDPPPPASSRPGRRNLMIKLSADDGRTWPWPVQRVLEPGPAGYSDLAVSPDHAIWCLFESGRRTGAGGGPAAITLVQFDLDWIFGNDVYASVEEFVPLFNEKDLTGWVNVNCAPETWTATNGVIHCTGFPTGELRTERMYQNFVLELEWRHLQPKGNAGVFVWADALTARGQPFHQSVEVQVLDGHEGENYTSQGDVFPIHGARMSPLNGRGGDRAFPVTTRTKPSPEWNHYRITCVDGVLTHAINGAVVTRGVNCSPRKGYICLESEGSPVEFRNLRIRELPSSRALAPEDIATPSEGFLSLYTGLDLRGWLVPQDVAFHWRPKDWILEHAGPRGPGPSTLWTAREFGDLELIVDWRRTAEPADGSSDAAIFLRGDESIRVPLGGSSAREWNRTRLKFRGNALEVVTNGDSVPIDLGEKQIPPRGRIGLQPSGGTDQFANVFVRLLD